MSEETRATDSSIRQRPVGRRDLLKLGATSAVLPAMIGPAAITERKQADRVVETAETDLTTSGPVSVGYWDGDPDTVLANARSMKAGDAALAKHGAQIQMIGMGLESGDAGMAGLQSLKVDVHFGTTSFRAWRYENSGVRNVSSPATFAVPVDTKQGLRFSVTAVHGSSAGITRAGGFTLHTGKRSSAPKLRAGFYVVAIGTRGSAPRINWDAFEIAGDSSGQSYYLRQSGKPVTSFPYLIFTISDKQQRTRQYV